MQAARTAVCRAAASRNWPHATEEDLYRVAAALGRGNPLSSDISEFQRALDNLTENGSHLMACLGASTGLPGSIAFVICVLNRDKPAGRRGKMLFVDAAQQGYYRAERAQNFLDEKHIASIVAACRTFEDVERFAHVPGLAEIEDNDFNLNISRYVDTTEPVETLPVAEALAQLREAERRRDKAAARMDALLAELGYQR